MTFPKTILLACSLFLGYIPCQSYATGPETTHAMNVSPDAPGVCSLTSKFDGEAHKITITWTGPADPAGTTPTDLDVSIDGALWTKGAVTPTTVEVKATTYARDDFSAIFTVKKKKPATGGGGGGGSPNHEGKGYANQVQILAYAPGSGISQMPRPSTKDEVYYGILAPHTANQPTNLDLVFNSKKRNIGTNTLTLNLPDGLDASGFNAGDNTTEGPLTIQVKLKEGKSGSQTVKLKLENDKGGGPAEDSVVLLPVEIVDANKAAVSKLKVAKMSDTGVLTGTGASAALDIDKDPDRFFIRISGGAALGGVSVKVQTTDNPIAEYNDDATQIDLQTDGNDAISKSLILVSDDIDDDYAVDGIADDATGDRTHKIQLGGNFKIKEIKMGNSAWQVLDSKAQVPVQKNVNLNVRILKLTSGGNPVISEASVENDLKISQERYAQAGIKLAWTIIAVDPPAGVNLADGLTEFTGTTPTAEEKALFDGEGLGTPQTDDIHVFYVNFFSPAPGSTGEAFPPSYFSGPADARYTNNLVISATLKGFSTLPHEIGHILLNDANHESDSKNLMFGTIDNVNRLLAKKRYRLDQESKMHSNTTLVK